MTQEHIKQLVFHFYQRIQKDELLGPVFNEVAQVNWEHHLSLLCRFWNSILLKTNEYHGNAYKKKHVDLGKKTKLHQTHFARWLQLFQEEAFIHLSFQVAQQIVDSATRIAKVLKIGTLEHKP